MEDSKISLLDPASSINGEKDLLVIVNENETRKITVNSLFAEASAIKGSIRLQGDWDSSTNSPDISSITPIESGFAWRVSVDGSTNLGGITDWNIGDLAVKTDSNWIKIGSKDIGTIWGSIKGKPTDQGDLVDYVNSVLPQIALLSAGTEQELISAINTINTNSHYIAGTIVFKNDIYLTQSRTFNLNTITIDLNGFVLYQSSFIIQIKGTGWVLKNGIFDFNGLLYTQTNTTNNLGLELLGDAQTIDPNSKYAYSSILVNGIFDTLSFNNYIGTLADGNPNIACSKSLSGWGRLLFFNCFFYSSVGNVDGHIGITNNPFVFSMQDHQGLTITMQSHRSMHHQAGAYSRAFEILTKPQSNGVNFCTDGSIYLTNTNFVIDYIAKPTNGTIGIGILNTIDLIDKHTEATDISGKYLLVSDPITKNLLKISTDKFDGGTTADNLLAHVNNTQNPHATTLEQARETDNKLTGDIDANNASTIVNLKTPINEGDAVPKSWVEGQIQTLQSGLTLQQVIQNNGVATDVRATFNSVHTHDQTIIYPGGPLVIENTEQNIYYTKLTSSEFVLSDLSFPQSVIKANESSLRNLDLQGTKITSIANGEYAGDAVNKGQLDSINKVSLGLDNVTNDLQIKASEKGAANGVAELDSNGKILSTQLPSFVDDILEFDSITNFPQTGEDSKIYIAKDSNRTYRWSGTLYVEISSSLALGETSTTAYRGDYGKTAYDHTQIISGNPHGTTASQVGAPSGSGVCSGTNTGDQDLGALVPNSRTINNKPLTSNITLTASDINAPSGSGTSTGINTGNETIASIGSIINLSAEKSPSLANNDMFVIWDSISNILKKFSYQNLVSAFSSLFEPKNTNIQSHISSTSNPHQTSLEQVRSKNNQIAGNIDANQNTIINIKNPTNAQDATNKQWIEAKQINSQYSISGGGDLSVNRTLQLSGDVASPSAQQYYGTSLNGTRGWFNKQKRIVRLECINNCTTQIGTMIGFTKHALTPQANQAIPSCPTTDPYNTNGYGNAMIDPFIVPAGYITQIGLRCSAACVTDGSVSNPVINIEVFKHSSTTRTSLGIVSLPVVTGNVTVYNSFSGNDVIAKLILSTPIQVFEGDVIGFQFNNGSGTTNVSGIKTPALYSIVEIDW